MTTTEETATTITRRTVAERGDDGWWLAMSEDGSLASYRTARGLLQSLQARDARDADRLGVNITHTIDWRNVPAGFDPERTRR